MNRLHPVANLTVAILFLGPAYCSLFLTRQRPVQEDGLSVEGSARGGALMFQCSVRVMVKAFRGHSSMECGQLDGSGARR